MRTLAFLLCLFVTVEATAQGPTTLPLAPPIPPTVQPPVETQATATLKKEFAQTTLASATASYDAAVVQLDGLTMRAAACLAEWNTAPINACLRTATADALELQVDIATMAVQNALAALTSARTAMATGNDDMDAQNWTLAAESFLRSTRGSANTWDSLVDAREFINAGEAAITQMYAILAAIP